MASPAAVLAWSAAAAVAVPLVAWPFAFASLMRVPEFASFARACPAHTAAAVATSAASGAAFLFAARPHIAWAQGWAAWPVTVLACTAAASTYLCRQLDRAPPTPPFAPAAAAAAAAAAGRTPPTRRALVTGATSGIGRSTVRLLAQAGVDVLFTTRSELRGHALANECAGLAGAVDFRVVDPNVLADVDAFAAAITGAGGWGADGIDVVVCNAGMFPRPSPALTADGFEPAFQVMHLAHHLLVERLGPAIRAVDGRVITVASEGHKMASPVVRGEPSSIYDDTRIAAPTTSGFVSYGHAKLANILHARYLRTAGINAFAIHPGAVATSIWTFPYLLGFLGSTWRKAQRAVFDAFCHALMKTCDQGAYTVVYLAFSPLAETSNSLYWVNLLPEDVGLSAHAASLDLAVFLRNKSNAMLATRSIVL